MMASGSVKPSESDGSSDLGMQKRRSTPNLPVPEGGYTWVILAAFLLVAIVMTVTFTAYSIMLQDIIVMMDTSTATASWGISVCAATSNFIAPLGAVAIHATSCRKMAILGGILLSCGLTLCYFAQDIATMIVVFGLCNGIGYGLTRISSLVLASHYFKKRYSTAVSTIFTGFSLGRFIFSPLVQISHRTYGVRGTFLLFGGLSMNICVGAALFQPAKWHYVPKPIVQEEPGADLKEHADILEHKDAVEKIENDALFSNSIIDIHGHDKSELEDVTVDKEPILTETGMCPLQNHRKTCNETDESSKDIIEDCPSKPSSVSRKAAALKKISIRGDVDSDHDADMLNRVKHRKSQRNDNGNWKAKLTGSLDFSLLNESIFYIILASHVLTNLSVIYGTVFFPTLCLDKGLTKMDSAILSTYRAAAEIAGRITIPVLQSFSHLDPIVFYILTSFIVSMAFLTQALAEGYYSLLLTGLFTGFLTGGSIIQATTITFISVGEKKLPSTLGLCAFFQGFFTLLGGPLMGRIRDVTGSLVYSYLLITAFKLVCGLVWIPRYFCQKNRQGANTIQLKKPK